jgi:hypothetical protein
MLTAYLPRLDQVGRPRLALNWFRIGQFGLSINLPKIRAVRLCPQYSKTRLEFSSFPPRLKKPVFHPAPAFKVFTMALRLTGLRPNPPAIMCSVGSTCATRRSLRRSVGARVVTKSKEEPYSSSARLCNIELASASEQAPGRVLFRRLPSTVTNHKLLRLPTLRPSPGAPVVSHVLDAESRLGCRHGYGYGTGEVRRTPGCRRFAGLTAVILREQFSSLQSLHPRLAQAVCGAAEGGHPDGLLPLPRPVASMARPGFRQLPKRATARP